jgi:hypothetical protein
MGVGLGASADGRVGAAIGTLPGRRQVWSSCFCTRPEPRRGQGAMAGGVMAFRAWPTSPTMACTTWAEVRASVPWGWAGLSAVRQNAFLAPRTAAGAGRDSTGSVRRATASVTSRAFACVRAHAGWYARGLTTLGQAAVAGRADRNRPSPSPGATNAQRLLSITGLGHEAMSGPAARLCGNPLEGRSPGNLLNTCATPAQPRAPRAPVLWRRFGVGDTDRGPSECARNAAMRRPPPRGSSIVVKPQILAGPPAGVRLDAALSYGASGHWPLRRTDTRVHSGVDAGERHRHPECGKDR